MARIKIEIEDLPNGNVAVRATPTFEEMLKEHVAAGKDFTAGEGYALCALNAIQKASREQLKKIPIHVPRLGR